MRRQVGVHVDVELSVEVGDDEAAVGNDLPVVFDPRTFPFGSHFPVIEALGSPRERHRK